MNEIFISRVKERPRHKRKEMSNNFSMCCCAVEILDNVYNPGDVVELTNNNHSCSCDSSVPSEERTKNAPRVDREERETGADNLTVKEEVVEEVTAKPSEERTQEEGREREEVTTTLGSTEGDIKQVVVKEPRVIIQDRLPPKEQLPVEIETTAPREDRVQATLARIRNDRRSSRRRPRHNNVGTLR